ncbi:multiubiquitin domain-containing protein [Caulobacter sp.]|uniref:multiubiquitin domain-containing protein n=1 Tax=Caulobacter sp. TaxID=78 RepID=UPI003BABF75E
MSANPTTEAFGGLFIEVADTDLQFRQLGVSDATLTGRQILSFCDATPREDYVVLQWLANGDIEELREDEVVDVRAASGAKFIVSSSDRLFRLVLNDRSLSWPERDITEAALRTLGKIAEDQILYVRREEEVDAPIPAGGTLALGDLGVEVVYAKAAIWKLNVQGVTVDSPQPTIIVRDALVKAGFDPDQGWIIVLKTADAKRQVGLDEVIDLRAPGIEKLRLTPREINNGEASIPRRAFGLLPIDETGLAQRAQRWETVVEGGRRWLLLHDVELPAGYSTARATIAVEVPSAYPAAELDMFYCAPALARIDGLEIPQTQVQEPIEGRLFQRWSRHRGAIAPWRPGHDNVITHLALIEAALLREVEQ